ncbi:MAG: GFA family protein [Pseudomonadota bacterium]
MAEAQSPMVTGHCYCGAISFESHKQPQTVAYCHCEDCKRASGAPVAAIAAFAADAIAFSPNAGTGFSPSEGVTRHFCGKCGSPLMSRFDYLPDQAYVPLGILDDASRLAPKVHAYESQRYPWLHIEDSAERFPQSSRAALRTSAAQSTEAHQ